MHIVALLLLCIWCTFAYGYSEENDSLESLTGINDRGIDESVSSDDGFDDSTTDELADKADSDDDDDGSGEIKKLNADNDGVDERDEDVETYDPGNYKSNAGIDDSDDNDDIPHRGKKTKKLSRDNDELDERQYLLELAAGDMSQFLGSNAHHHEQRFYKDLSRRFVPVYPYKERKTKDHKPDPDEIIQFITSSKKVLRDNEDRDIVPIEAPPEVVLAVMQNGTEEHSSKPSDATEKVIRQQMLRNGDYWDGVWKEEVYPDDVLRTKKHHLRQASDFRPIKTKLVPGTKLYDLLAEIVKKTPKLVYFINK